MSTKRLEVQPSSGNVFADLGLPDADELYLKTQLALAIRKFIRECDLTQQRAAEMLGIDQPKVSLLMGGKLKGFSCERLFKFLNRLGHDVRITLSASPTTEGAGRTTIVEAA